MSEKRQSTIGREFSLGQLFAFVAPAVFTRLFVSLLSTLDDSLFVSRYLGQNALAAFSLLMPWFMLMDAIGMVGASVSVVCSIKMGEKKNEEAKSDFTTMLLVTFFLGSCMTLVMVLFRDPILHLLGETEILMPYARTFVTVSRFYIPLFLVNYTFGSFYVIAGKPKCSMYVSMINISCQFFFDWLFIVKMQMGIVGAAYANLIGTVAVTLFALIFYSRQSREICFVKPASEAFPLVKKVFRYGRMQAITSIALSLSAYIYNAVFLSIGGEELIAAYSIVSNVVFMFMNSFFGLIGSTSPIASYAFGEKNPKKLTRVMKQTVILMSCLIAFIITLIISLRRVVIALYLTDTSSENVKSLVSMGLSIYPLSLIFFGYNVYVQEILNVLGNHKVSLFLSILENVVFVNIAVVALPYLFGIKAVWYVFLVSEALTFLPTICCVWHYRDVYGYGKDGIATFINR